MRRVLITGGAGFLGRNLARRLCDEGIDVWRVDNLFVAPTGRVPNGVDQRDVRQLRVADLDSVDTVVHLAALKSVPASFRDRALLAHNVSVDHHVLDIFAASAASRLLLASSCEVYGDRPGPHGEGDARDPRSPYAVGKTATELLAEVYRTLSPHKQIGAIRFFNVYGPDEGADAVVPGFLDAATAGRPCTIEGDGTQARDLTHVDDAMEMLWAVLASDRPLHSVLNVGSGQAVSVSALAEEVIRTVGRGTIAHTAPRPNEIGAFVADMRAYAAAYGAPPSRGLRDGLRVTYRDRLALLAGEAYAGETATAVGGLS